MAHAGISEPLLGWLLGAKGLSGQAAQAYLGGATAGIKNSVISRKQQYDLFLPVYEYMKAEVIRVSSKFDTVQRYGDFNWEAAHAGIKELLIDLRYRGDYDSGSRVLLQKHAVKNDYISFSRVLSDRSKWSNVPLDRFNRRVHYLGGL